MTATTPAFADPERSILTLLRDAAQALRDAGLRPDLVTEVELAGVLLPTREPRTPRWDRVEGMRRVAQVLKREAVPMSTVELRAALWPQEPLPRVRGWIGLLVGEGWLVQASEPPHPKYLIGASRAWAEGPSPTMTREAEIEALRRRLAELAGGAG